jgi:hypothetical protein
MEQTTAAFIEELRRDVARWKVDLAGLDVGQEAHDEYLKTSEIRAWIEAGEAILARYESRRAQKAPRRK